MKYCPYWVLPIAAAALACGASRVAIANDG
jgi:hypothetical protein